MDADSDCEVKDKEKLQAVVTSFDQVSFLKLMRVRKYSLCRVGMCRITH